MKKKAKIILISLAALLAVGFGAATLLAPVKVEVVALEPAPAALTFTETGVYQYDSLFSVYPLLEGEVLEVVVKEGDVIQPGEVIALVNASNYQHQIEQLRSTAAGYSGQISDLWLQDQQRKDQLSSNLEQLRGQLVSLEAEIQQQRTGNESLEEQVRIQEDIIAYNRGYLGHTWDALRDAKDEGDDYSIRQARLAYSAAQTALSQSEMVLEQLQSGGLAEGIYEGQRQSVQAQMDALSAQMGKSYTSGMHQYYSAQIAAVEASIAQMEEMAGRAEITAPVGGVVSKLPVKDQNVVSGQLPVAVIGNQPCVEVFVPQREIDGVSAGDSVQLVLDKRTGKDTLTGVILEVEREAQIRISALGIEERKVRVLIQPEKPLPIGYDMDVRFTPHQWEEAILIPKTALFSVDGGDYVWTLENGVFHHRAVVKGPETREGYLIDQGLYAGDLVVVDAGNKELAVGKRAAAE